MIRNTARPLMQSFSRNALRTNTTRFGLVQNTGKRFMTTAQEQAQKERTWNQNSRKNSNWKLMAGVALGAAAATFYVVQADEKPDYNKVREAIVKILDDDDNKGPTLVRLAWHASGTFSVLDKTGGSQGATIRFHPERNHGANAGLDKAMEWLEPIKKAFPGISYADLYTLAGVVAIEEMGGPKITWRPGRTDAPNGDSCTPSGRLPDADKGTTKTTIQHIRDIFYRMGFNDKEIVALIGAHSIGRCHRDRSGYEGPWTRAPTAFSNEFFRELLENTWTKKKWEGPEQYTDPTGDLMMLPADLALLQDPVFRKYVELYAKDEKQFFQDFAKAFQKLEELGTPLESKGWFSWLW